VPCCKLRKVGDKVGRIRLFQILVVEADRGGDDGIGGCEDPAQYGNEVHPIEDHAVADRQAFVPADIGDAGGGRQPLAFATIVQHGEPVIIALYKHRNEGCDPADQGEEGEDEDGDGIDCLPQGIAEGEADAPSHVLPELGGELDVLLFSVDQGFGLFAQVGEYGGADDQEEIFEQREVEEDQHQPHHDASHEKKKAEEGALPVVEEAFNTDHPAKPGDGGIIGFPEEIHADDKEDRIYHPRDQDPFPQPMLTDELVRLDVGLEGYYNFFEQGAFLFVYLFA